MFQVDIIEEMGWPLEFEVIMEITEAVTLLEEVIGVKVIKEEDHLHEDEVPLHNIPPRIIVGEDRLDQSF